MATKSLLAADDLGDRSAKGRLRSRVIRDNAIEVAKKMGLKIELLYVANLRSALFKKKQIASFVASFDAIKESVENQFAKAQVPIKIKIEYGDPAEEILNEINILEKPQILILGTQGKKGLKKILLGSVAEEVIRNSHLPTMVLGPVVQEKRSVIKIDENLQILFLTDFGDSSTAAETFVMNFCKEFNCPVLILYSVGEQIMRIRESFYTTGYIPFDIEKMFNQMTEDAQRNLQRKVRDWNKLGIKTKSLLIEKEESLEATFKKQTSPKTDLIVMGTHGRNKIVSSFIGSSARKVILNSPVPVIVLGPPKNKS